MTVEMLAPPVVNPTPETQEEFWRYMVREPEVYETNLPLDVDIFYNPETPLQRAALKPEQLDWLSVGAYVVQCINPRDSEDPRNRRDIAVSETTQGRSINNKALRMPMRPVEGNPGVAKLMGELGFKLGPAPLHFDDYRVDAFPTPETVKNAAHTLGVEVQLMPGEEKIKAEPYLTVFANGKYPVATGHEKDYIHDIEDDHLTAMVLGGAPLKSALQKVARQALETREREVMEDTTSQIDLFTFTLRGVLSWNPFTQSTSYSEESGRNTLRGAGGLIGLSDAEVDEILLTAQTNARKFTFELKKLQ